MSTTTHANAALVRKNLLKAYKLYNDESKRNVWKDMVAGNVVSTDQLYEQTALVSGVSLPSIVGEYGTVPVTDVSTPYTKTHTPQKRIIQFRMSDEFFINDKYGVANSYGRMLGHVFYVAQEIAGAVFMNGCTSSSTISTPAGQPLASTAHPLESGTDSNRFGTAQTLGISALEQAIQSMMSLQAHKGYVNPISGPFNLEVAPANALLASRLVNSTLLPQGENNDVNALKGMISKVVVNPWFTNSGFWAIHSANPMENRRIFLERYPLKVTELVYDGDNDSWKVTVKQSYLFDVTDYRDTYYSPAA